MATVNGTPGKDFIHRLGDGRTAPPGYTDVTGATTGDDAINGFDGNDMLLGDASAGGDLLDGGAGFDFASYLSAGPGSRRALLIPAAIPDMRRATSISRSRA